MKLSKIIAMVIVLSITMSCQTTKYHSNLITYEDDWNNRDIPGDPKQEDSSQFRKATCIISWLQIFKK